MMNSQVICSLALEIYFCNGHRNAVSFNTIFLICVSTLFRYIEKESCFFTLFCFLKNKNNRNFTVSIHKVPVVVLLIIRIVNFRFRFKCEIMLQIVLPGPMRA